MVKAYCSNPDCARAYELYPWVKLENYYCTACGSKLSPKKPKKKRAG